MSLVSQLSSVASPTAKVSAGTSGGYSGAIGGSTTITPGTDGGLTQPNTQVLPTSTKPLPKGNYGSAGDPYSGYTTK
jgi:hypothetical protein